MGRSGFREYGLLLFVGVSIAEFFVLHTDLTAPIIVAMAAVISASFSPAAVVARRHLQLDVGLSHVRDVLVLLAVGTAAAAMSAVLASLLLPAADELTIGDLTQSSFPLFVGDIIQEPSGELGVARRRIVGSCNILVTTRTGREIKDTQPTMSCHDRWDFKQIVLPEGM